MQPQHIKIEFDGEVRMGKLPEEIFRALRSIRRCTISDGASRQVTS